jgi:hypothetical protein
MQTAQATEGETKMTIINQPGKIFANYAAAAKACAMMESNEFRIDADPKGSGRCLVRILDEETGEVVGTL